MNEAQPAYSIVVATIGRPCLTRLLSSLAAARGPEPVETIVVDDRAEPREPLELGSAEGWVKVVSTGGGRGPASARNAGWRLASAPWVAFLDDDVVVGPSWKDDLGADLEAAERLGGLVGASQGRLRVPLPQGKRPTDWERNVAGLEGACWATADMAYRRDVLEEVEGFDERFLRAYREDSDLGLRVTAAGWLIVRGERLSEHPVRPAGRTVSVRLQAGNADDALMRRLHGPEWRHLCHAGPGRNGRHLTSTVALIASAGGLAARRRRVAGVAGFAWAAMTGRFAWQRIAPGPRCPSEVATMLATSAAIPPVAVWHRVKAELALAAGTWAEPAGLALPHPTVTARLRYGPVPRPLRADHGWKPKAILFDRDGTLIADRVYLSDPGGVTLMPGARMAVRRAREAGLRVGVVSNQSGVGRGLLTVSQMEAVNRRVDEMTGGLDTWAVCVHRPDDHCGCRKPAPGLVLQAAEDLGVDPGDCAVIGDIEADLGAAAAAGARSVLVPTRRTLRSEIRAARQVAPDLLTAVDLVLGSRL